MITKWGLAVSVICGVCLGAETKEITIHFDPTRLRMEARGTMTLFRYNDPACKYIEHEAGAPILPAVFFNVLVPKGAVYVRSRVRAETQGYRGVYHMYTRTRPRVWSAKRYPASLVEFVGYRELEGFRVLTFRAYPVCCQPGDGSVARVLRVTMLLEYTVKGERQPYAPVSPVIAARVKRCVINPDDLEAYSMGSRERRRLGGEVAGGGADYEAFATQIRERRSGASAERDVGVFNLLKENVYISEENDLVCAPIRF
ncbi:MAG: hypothetical protein N2595_05630 [bacterium]|nr:hypothetical protein [bacterium]